MNNYPMGTTFTVRCHDGVERGGVFTSHDAAGTFADHGHFCKAHHTVVVHWPADHEAEHDSMHHVWDGVRARRS